MILASEILPAVAEGESALVHPEIHLVKFPGHDVQPSVGIEITQRNRVPVDVAHRGMMGEVARTVVGHQLETGLAPVAAGAEHGQIQVAIAIEIAQRGRALGIKGIEGAG